MGSNIKKHLVQQGLELYAYLHLQFYIQHISDCEMHENLFLKSVLCDCALFIVHSTGEQGAISLFPLLLVDRGMDSATVMFCSGFLGMVTSIAGSFWSGALLSKYGYMITYYHTELGQPP